MLSKDQVFQEFLSTLHEATLAVATPLPIFVILSMFVKRDRFLIDLKRALPEGRLNLMIHFADSFLVAPLLVSILASLTQLQSEQGTNFLKGFWAGQHPVVTIIAAVLFGDFIGYWRHRLEHTAFFWPSHAVHHSDTEMSWLAVFRIHPFNRIITAIADSSLLLSLGMPPYAVLVNGWVRHYYGALVHADLPWTYGRLGLIFVSPAMHRWHHAIDSRAYNKNFATIFAFFDLAFGTFRVPGVCGAPLGVSDRMSTGFLGQMMHPLKRSSYLNIKGAPGESVSPLDRSSA